MDTQDLFLEIGREFHLTYDQVSEICNRLTGRFLEITSSTREQIAREQKEYLDHWQDFYLDTYPDDVIDCVGRDLIAIAKGSDVNGE